MKIIEYNNSDNIVVEFQDEFKHKKRTTYSLFRKNSIRNPYYPSYLGIGIVGVKYSSNTKEYIAWSSMITRCYSKLTEQNKNFYYKYQNVSVCKEWLLYETFYEWLHSQDNWDILKDSKFEIDKDILIKGNKVYSPETCCLVPHNVNTLFIKCDKLRGNYPIGVTYKARDDVFEIQCSINGKETYLGRSKTPEDGFLIYKNFKENLIKQIAHEEYSKGTITKRCYEAMLRYQIEITD